MTESRALTDLSISEAAADIRRGETSSVALTQATLARIKETEPTLQAYAAVPAELALAAAERADRELAAGHDRGFTFQSHTHDSLSKVSFLPRTPVIPEYLPAAPAQRLKYQIRFRHQAPIGPGSRPPPLNA